jgi:hypothetical protein
MWLEIVLTWKLLVRSARWLGFLLTVGACATNPVTRRAVVIEPGCVGETYDMTAEKDSTEVARALRAASEDDAARASKYHLMYRARDLAATKGSRSAITLLIAQAMFCDGHLARSVEYAEEMLMDTETTKEYRRAACSLLTTIDEWQAISGGRQTRENCRSANEKTARDGP